MYFSRVGIIYGCVGVSRMGVPEDWIIKFVAQKEAFCKVPEVAILEAIELLVGGSLVYLFSAKSYKTVT